MSNSIIVTGTKEFIENSSDIFKNSTSENLNLTDNFDSIDNNFDWLIFFKYIIFFSIILLIFYFVLYNNGITLDYIIRYFVYGSGETIKKTVDTSVKGANISLDVAKKSIENAVNVAENAMGIDNNDDKNDTDENNFDLDSSDINKKLLKNNIEFIPQPNDMQNNIKKKSGYCYIGEDRGFRSCAKVSQHDTCMSGDIFPTRDICINPNLRQ